MKKPNNNNGKPTSSTRIPAGVEQDGATVYKTGTYQMFWDCEYCNTPKLLGITHRFCPNCGAPQATEKRYFPKKGEEIALENHDYVGADQLCPACETANAAKAEFCQQCGSPLTEAARAKLVQDENQAKKPDSKKNNRLYWIIAGVLLLLIGGGVGIFWTKNVGLTLTAYSWERVIEIEDYRARNDNTWCDSVPTEAYSVSRKSEIRSYRDVPDGEACTARRVDQGDGTFRTEDVCKPKYKSEPIYADKCYYSIDRWQFSRSVTTQDRNHEPQWGAYQLKGNGGTCQGCEREGKRQAHYYLHLTDNGKKSYQCDVDEKQWQTVELKSQWKMSVGGILGEARCGTLQKLP
ncbi:zinc ribbon domain-containing protein [Beggiatoa leptomitoformis]|uniref:DZANK-type domain-containing protein n=1 Tax=Beggiatoa leptomitoformis TaxID=288004 RepID=A0A2N9YEV3_9GAMM|nr:zinc ribbon domain-containing protein [Beggiatoa leptomitoformis]AUI69018.1 hypothetical protein BLE401_10120 [Beggiatoa leptomitoformis]QGX03764.1 hypothetical protein AL038_19245 [Beggiatoa leptomitoformis]